MDDSSDNTSEIIEKLAEEWRTRGVNCQRLTRPTRVGYKAGNLHAHSEDVRGDFVALFDADHRCEPDYLRKAIPHFFNEDGSDKEKVGLVATPWAYYNTSQNLLTEYDTLVLDYVFGVDRVALAGAQNFFGFNGTGGVWRQAAIDAAGGWKWDTVTEDLDTSVLAHMAGYEFVYLRHLPQELESTGNILAHRKQKRRWTKGRWQILRKRMGDVALSSSIALKTKVEMFFHLTVSMTYPIALISAILAPVVASYGAFTLGLLIYVNGFNTFVFVSGILTASFGKISRNGSYQAPHARIVRAILMIPVEMAFAVGMSVFETAATIDGWFSDDATFHRTAKAGSGGYGLYKNEVDSVVASEQAHDEDGNVKAKKKKKSYENEHLEAILGLLFAVYDCVWIAINVKSKAVTQDPIAIFMGIVVPLMASIGLTYMHGWFLYELVLRYIQQGKQRKDAFQNSGETTKNKEMVRDDTFGESYNDYESSECSA